MFSLRKVGLVVLVLLTACDEDSPRPTIKTHTPTPIDVEVASPSGEDICVHSSLFQFCLTTPEGNDPPAEVRWIVLDVKLFEESGSDPIEYIRNNDDAPEWSAWTAYEEDKSGLMCSWVGAGDWGQFFLFAVQARDTDGAVTELDESRHTRRFRVNRADASPLGTIRCELFGEFPFSGIPAPPRIIDIPTGLQLQFTLTGTAGYYCGAVIGYRSGWDLSELGDWQEFNDPMFVREPPRSFLAGVHTFRAEIIDNSGFISAVEIKVNVIPFTMDREVLLVDDYREPELVCDPAPCPGMSPTDEQHDAFWESILDGVAGFVPELDVVEADVEAGIPLTQLGAYKSIIWVVRGDTRGILPNALHEIIKFRRKDHGVTMVGKLPLNVLSLYMRAGGRLMIAGANPVSMAINADGFITPKYPMIVQWEIGGDIYEIPPNEPPGDESFPFLDLCVDVLDQAAPDPLMLRSGGVCGVGDIRDVDIRTTTLRRALPIDRRFPVMDLRPEAAGPGKWYEESRRGLDSELYNPPYFMRFCRAIEGPARDCFAPIYGLGCLDTSEPAYHSPVAFWFDTYADVDPAAPGVRPARGVIFGFAPVFFKPDEVKAAMDVILFDEWGHARR